MKTFDAQIEECRTKMRNINFKKREYIDGGTVGNTKVTYRDYLKEKIDGAVALKKEKRKHIEQLDEV